MPAFISMISGTPGTTSPRPRAQYSRADGSSRAREHAGRVDLSAPHHDPGSDHRGGFGRSNRTGPVMTLGTFWARSVTEARCSITCGATICGLTRLDKVERVTRIELAWPAWKAGALPLSYTRVAVMIFRRQRR